MLSSATCAQILFLPGLLAIGACWAGPPPDSTHEDARASRKALEAPRAASAVQVGTRCQEDYPAEWEPTVPDTWRQCESFNSGIAPASPVKFYYNLHGAQPAFQDEDTCGWSCGYVDSVDLFYTLTHGGIDNGDQRLEARWAMWDKRTYARSQYMRLGASGRQNMVFVTGACDTHRVDAYVLERWKTIFAGGLILTLGGHHLIWSGHPGQGADFANRMRNGEPIGQAWLEATFYADNANTPAVLSTGGWNRSPGDPLECFTRQDTTVLDNLITRSPIRDGDVGALCWTTWN
ncbi:DUF6345 domain-containing protein [Pendulispora brunnea]|uniref:DUF6345 domain-containing protein n=1 Tax=Pendulispora brunnea TaxID=2905690 RepID=A0ABZ2KK40_9BACT